MGQYPHEVAAVGGISLRLRPGWGATRTLNIGGHAGPPSPGLRSMPGCRAGAADEDVEHLAAGRAKAGKLGQVEAVWQRQRAPATAKQPREALRGAVPRTVGIEGTIDGKRLGQRGQSLGWTMRAANGESR